MAQAAESGTQGGQQQPDELYTLRAQFQLGHYAAAVNEAKQVARRPMSAALKVEREEYLMRAHAALHQYDKCTVVTAGDATAGESLFCCFLCFF